jgi:hypothetical protein
MQVHGCFVFATGAEPGAPGSSRRIIKKSLISQQDAGAPGGIAVIAS